MASAGMPISSQVSRRAVSTGFSPASRRPPGKHTSPGWWPTKVSARVSKSRQSFPSHWTRGTRMAYSPTAPWIPSSRWEK